MHNVVNSIAASAGEVRVGVATTELIATDDMVIAGGIGPGYAKGQDGLLRAVGTVVEGPPNSTRVAIVALDILGISRDYLDDAALAIEEKTGIPFDHVVINCTHTHHAPAAMKFHGYDAIPEFAIQVRDAAVTAVVAAERNLAVSPPARSFFIMGRESTIGQNSRIEMRDGTISWTRFTEGERLRSTGPVDSDFPVLAFKSPDGTLTAAIFGHSAHPIGTRNIGRRSPAFLGLAAQEFERQTGAVTTFVAGASGSTHMLGLEGVPRSECLLRAEERILNSLRYHVDQAPELDVYRVGSLKREIVVRVRDFDERAEERAVSSYCQNESCDDLFGLDTAAVFRQERAELATHRGKAQKTWISATRFGDVAMIGVPAELFAQVGLDIKKRSPFRHTFIAELANDSIGYVANADAYRLGGYQLWMGHHSWTERGTGELLADEAVKLLHELLTTS